MLLPPRLLTIHAAIACFFALAVVGSLSGLSPGTCCKRAVLGAAIAGAVTGAAVRAINAILTEAMIAHQTDRKEDRGDHRD